MTSTTSVPRPHAAVAGAVGAAVGLGAAETPHAFAPTAPSLVLAVGARVIRSAPEPVIRLAIGQLGTNDKPGLLIGIVVVCVALGGAVGVLARRRPLAAAGTFAAAAALGAAASATSPGGSPGAAFLVGALGAVAGIAAGSGLLHLAARAIAGGTTDAPGAALPSRRAFLLGAVSLGVVAALPVAVGRSVARGARAAAARARVVLPRAVRPAPPPPVGSSFAELGPIVTANDAFYRIDTALAVPDIDPASWQLSVRGMVDRPFTITYDELLAMPMVEEHVTLSCVSNEVGGSLVGTARWLGVPLSALLERAGVQAGATQLVGRSVDGFTAGFPTGAATDGRTALVAVGMNGEPLPTAHGFPARLVVAGLYGYVSATKWLSEIELTTLEAVDGFWVPRGWAKQAPIKTESRIDVPRLGQRLAAGPVVVAGVAWAPTRGVSRVEVRADDGPWEPAELSVPLNDETWVQWRYRWEATPGRHRLAVRATDGRGSLQDATDRPPPPDGATGYHRIVVNVAGA